MSRDRVIGSGDGMPWNIPEEYQHFLNTIRGQTILMGRRSYEIFGPDLTSEHNLVVTRSNDEFQNAVAVSDLEEAIERARSLPGDVFIAGGGSIYAQTIDRADRMYLSFIKGEFRGDVYFPEIHAADWEVTDREDRDAYEFVNYRRRTTADRP